MLANQTFSRTEFLESVRYKKAKRTILRVQFRVTKMRLVFFFHPGVTVPPTAAFQDPALGAGSQCAMLSQAPRLGCLARFEALLAGICSLQAASPLLKRRAVVICSILGKLSAALWLLAHSQHGSEMSIIPQNQKNSEPETATVPPSPCLADNVKSSAGVLHRGETYSVCA